ncbi:Uncharacterized conserved protein YkwD, contains CAP (CSP/antigen 5/PR1) domain [Arthrobacter sp. ok362]|nr:Uncharacterized conserved protein YkwD, contains CAP (CSP/antigen 5/PR1) domain [Arthrobacter sp. ok362]
MSDNFFGGQLKISITLGATLLTAALVAGPICGASAAPAAPPVPVATQSASVESLDLFPASKRQMIIDTFDAINRFRATKHLMPLKFNVRISTISQKWSNKMATTGRFEHNSDYVTGAPAGYFSASENIALGYTAGQDLVNGWISSPGHNANMSQPDATFMGIGISTGSRGTYATANHFGYPAGTVPPGSYNSPRDYFNGRPALRATSGTPAALDPTVDWEKLTYTIPAKTGVIYLVNGAVKAAGTYPFRSIVVTIDVKTAAGGHTLTAWTYDLSSLAVTAAAPKFSQAKGTYTIPATSSVTYLVNGAVKPPGTYSRSTRITITAEAAPGHILTGTSSWSIDFRKAVTAAKPAMNSTTNRYTIPKQTGVAYFVNGKPVPAGTYKAANGKTVNFTAKAASSAYRLTGTSTWSYRF